MNLGGDQEDEMLKQVQSMGFEISLFSDRVHLLNLRTREETTLTSSWLQFNVFEKKAYDIGGWTDGSYQYHNKASPSHGARLANVDVCEKGGDILVSWDQGDAHTYSLNWLWDTAVHPDVIGDLVRVPWKKLDNFPVFDYARVMNMDEPSEMIACLTSYFVSGICLIKDVPPNEESIRSFAERISIIQNTQFEDIYALKMKENPTNLAEVNGHVFLHNDIVFHKNPPAVQVLHVLKQASTGGENLFVDGLNIVDQLSSDDVAILRKTPLNFVNQSSSIHYRSVKPILVYDLLGTFQEIHFNKDKMTFPPSVPASFYETFARLEALLNHPSNCDDSFRVPENTIAIIDNLRLLHGRRAFTDPQRSYLSCYVYGDELRNRYRVLVEEQRSTQRGER